MTEHERLIRLLNDCGVLCNDCGNYGNSYCIEAIADYLLKNGVTVPQCKAGDTVYQVIEKCNPPFGVCIFSGGYGTDRCRNKEHGDLCSPYIKEVKFNTNMCNRINDDIFLTYEEAEKTLKKIEEINFVYAELKIIKIIYLLKNLENLLQVIKTY